MKSEEEACRTSASIAKHPADEKQIRLQHELGNSPTYVDALDVNGPFNALPPPLPQSYKSLHLRSCAGATHA